MRMIASQNNNIGEVIMNTRAKRLLALMLSMLLIASVLAVPVSAATYKKGTNSVSSSYKNGPYYSNFSKVPLTGDGRLDVVAVAMSQLGYEESSSINDLSGLNGSDGYNITEYNYNMGDFGSGYGYYWCATFVSWALYQSNCTDQIGYSDWTRNHTGDSSYIWCEVSCSQWAAQLRRYGHWKHSLNQGGSAYTPQSGDLIFFTWDGAYASEDHIGIVVYSDGTTVYTVEGNTSDASGLDSNGGGVYFKSYNLSATTLAGFGVMPYKSVSSAKKIDYSGANPTTGLYMATKLKNIYANPTDSNYTWRMARFTMFEVIGVSSDKSMLKAVCTTTTGETVTGWVKNNTDRVVQLTCTEEENPEKTALEELVAKAIGIDYTDYSESALSAIRSAYSNAKNVLANDASTDANYKSAYNTLNSALANTTKILSVGKSYTSSAQVRNDDYVDDGIVLTDGIKNATDGGSTGYAGWQKSAEIVVDLGSSMSSDTYTVYLAGGAWGIYLPKSKYFTVEVLTSNSATSGFTSVGSTNDFVLTFGSNLGEESWSTYTATVTANSAVNARYVKFVLKNEECTGHIWLDEVEVSLGATAASGSYITKVNSQILSGDCTIFTPSFGTVTGSAANHKWTHNIVAKWDSAKKAYVVKSSESGVGDATPDITLASDEILIAAHSWEVSDGASESDAIVGSKANKDRLICAKVGDLINVYGVDVASGTILPGAYITLRGTGVIDNNTENHYPGDAADCTNGQHCISCGKELAPANGHDDGEWVILEDGSKVLQCTVCGEVIEDDYLAGDANGDGVIDMFDYLMIKSIYFEKYVPSEIEAKRSDANKDGVVDMFDYLVVQTTYFNS